MANRHTKRSSQGVGIPDSGQREWGMEWGLGEAFVIRRPKKDFRHCCAFEPLFLCFVRRFLHGEWAWIERLLCWDHIRMKRPQTHHVCLCCVQWMGKGKEARVQLKTWILIFGNFKNEGHPEFFFKHSTIYMRKDYSLFLTTNPFGCRFSKSGCSGQPDSQEFRKHQHVTDKSSTCPFDIENRRLFSEMSHQNKPVVVTQSGFQEFLSACTCFAIFVDILLFDWWADTYERIGVTWFISASVIGE